MSESVPQHLGWWTIAGESLMELLQRVEQGETAEAVYMEAYANSVVTPPDLTEH